MSTPSASRIQAFAMISGTAAWFALIAGLGEAFILGVRSAVFHQFIWSSRHVGWMAPISYLLFFGPPALIAAAIAAWRPRVVPVALVAGGLAGLVIGLWLRLVSLQRLHPLAIVVFAAGAAVQVGRWVQRHPTAWPRFVRRTGPWLAAAVCAIVVTTAAWQWDAERRARAAVPAPADPAPNILLLLLDTVRAAELGLYGYGRPTSPNLDSLGHAGVVFERALSTAPWTLPSHGTLFTGRPAFALSTGFLHPLDRTEPTLAETLSRRGYRTAGFVANHWYTSWESGLARGFAHYRDYPVSLRQLLLSAELGQVISDYRSRLILRTNDAQTAAEISAEFLAWLPRAADQPFFAFLNYFDAHMPYHTPWAYERQFAAGHPAVDRYDAALAFLDAELGGLMAELGRRGVLDRTIVIITSDHGELLGEHGMDNHGNALYQQLLHVPLIILGPGIPEAVRVPAQVSLDDVAATILDLAGAAAEPTPSLPGRSLARFWREGAPFADSLIVAQVERHPTAPSWYRNRAGPMWTLFMGRWHLIRNPDGRLELYDWWSDPAEEQDRVADQTIRDTVEHMRDALEAVRNRAPARAR